MNTNLNSNDVQKILKLTNDVEMSQNKDKNNMSLSGVGGDDTNASTFYDDEEMSEEDVNSKSNGDTDLDTEDALKEFAFLSSESSSGSDIESSSDWNVDKAHLSKLTEQYKKDRRSAKNAKMEAQHSLVNTHRPNRSTLQAMIANLTDETSENLNDSTNSQTNITIIGNKTTNLDLSPNSTGNKNEKIKFNAQNNNLFCLEDDSFANDSNLGELSRLSVGNSMNLSGINDDTIIDVSAYITGVGSQLE